MPVLPASTATITTVPRAAAHRPRGRSAAGWRTAVAGGLGLWAAVRILLTAFGLLVEKTTAGVAVRPAVPHSFFTLFYHWDSSYFLAIAQRGYFAPGEYADIAAFLPGYPLAARLATFAAFPGGSFSTADVLVGLWLAALIPSAVAAVGMWRLASVLVGERSAPVAVILLVAGPYAVFLAASYSESLFLAFAVFAWYSAVRGRWWVAGILGAAASLTRIDGLFLAVALGVVYLQSTGPLWHRRIGRAVAVVALSASSLVGYFVYLFAATGDPLAWLTAEHDGWHRRFTMPWASGLHTLVDAGDEHLRSAVRAQSLLEVVFAVLAVAGLVLLVRRRWWGAAVLVGTMLVSLTTSTTYLSLSRETLLMFPPVLLLASFRDRPGRRWILVAAGIVGALLLLFTTREFVLGHWAQ